MSYEERIKQLPISLPLHSLNSNTISANDINLFYETEKDISNGISRIDLHGYSVKDAQYRVIRAIKFFYSNQYCDTILFITGRGKHINNRGERGTLFKLFPQWLKDESISHIIDKCKPQIGAYEQKWVYPTINFILVKAAKWFLKAAEQGLSPAQLMVGFLYMIGSGVQHDFQQGLYWYHMAARQNNPIAMRNIAFHHLTKNDYKDAKDWFCKAYEAGDACSANQIGIMYKFGIGTLCDLQKAEEWYRKSAEANDNHGKVNLGTQLLKNGNKVEGIKWIKEAAIAGLADAQLHLGEAYYLQGDVDEGKKWWLKSAMQNAGRPSGHAQLALGVLTNDSKEKLKWYQKAADNDVKIAQISLALMYRDGHCGLKKDDAKVFKLYTAAAKDTKHYGYNEKGNHCAQYHLGECYELGLLKVNKNLKKALKWYKEAAKQKSGPALMRLGIIQENNLTLTEIQEKLEGIHTLPTSKELEKVDILVFLLVYSPPTRHCSFKRATDELNESDEILGYAFFDRRKCIQVEILEPVEPVEPIETVELVELVETIEPVEPVELSPTLILSDLRQKVISLLEKHFHLHPLIPDINGNFRSSTEIWEVSVKEICNGDLYFSSYYVNGISLEVVKRDYLPKFFRPRLDLVTYIIISRLILHHQQLDKYQRGRKVVSWRKEFKSEWISLKKKKKLMNLIWKLTNVKTWTYDILKDITNNTKDITNHNENNAFNNVFNGIRKIVNDIKAYHNRNTNPRTWKDHNNNIMFLLP
ncbi:Sel1 repeat family protein [Rhizophagus clarus]|uniref:Sel1 repeat family protein n=1 Tax=Rhizophagus clarus TaxID=94130 RepID=A0A8H3R106_9GLOM|nr:Sel1 repeat family protein [Rhizophagus clarus]